MGCFGYQARARRSSSWLIGVNIACLCASPSPLAHRQHTKEMSLLTDFVDSVADDVIDTIGASSMVVSGIAVLVVKNQVTESREYEDTGFRKSNDAQVVAKTADLPAISIGLPVTLDGVALRISMIQKGASFTTITLSSQDSS